MENLRRHFGLAVLVSELGHVFCCILPTILTVLSFAANLGLIGVAPGWMTDLHQHIHHYELHIIVFSSVVLIFGWFADWLGRQVDCDHSGHDHAACGKEKKRNHIIMLIATVLFAINIFIYLGIHKNVFRIDALSIPPAIHKDISH